jgi:cellulose 1,4-beta-cellobiosidase
MKIALSIALAASLFVECVVGQNVGTETAESHPSLTVETCTSGGCTSQTLSIVLDSNWRWTHQVGTTTNCYTGNTWDATLCPDDATCATNCALDGADYGSTYGISTSGNALTLDFVTTTSTGTNVGSRTYLLASSTEYQMLSLLNQEFTFDVDVTNLPCGLNGALYFSEMTSDGGMAAHPTNKCGATYGTGYCDSQCPRDLKWIDGQGNVEGWVASANNANTGTGNYGSCCNELDIWEANSLASAYTPHTCTVSGQYMCTGTTCGIQPANRYGGVCDPDGCDFNSYRMGDTTFYGPGLVVNTNSVFTVVTQFLTSTGTSSGTLNDITRFYVQNGVIIPNSYSNFPGFGPYNSITDAFCNAKVTLFGDSTGFETKGGLAEMGTALSTGMVLVMSLWDDYAVDMLWLDSDYPTNDSVTKPGVARGPCPTTSGVPATVESQSPGAYVIYSNIKWGAINSTFSGTLATTTGSATSTTSAHTTTTTHTTSTHTTSTHTTTTHTTTTHTTTTTASGCSSEYSQCGGIGWAGPTCCVSPYVCVYSNPYYSQCLT